MTPAILLAQISNIKYKLHQYEHDPKSTSYGLEAAHKLNVDESRVFKTLVVKLDSGALAVAVIPVSSQLSMKHLAKALACKKADMADTASVQRSTGYVLGGVSPLGQKKSLATVIDTSAEAFPTVYVSAGRRGLEIELKASDLKDLTRASFASICR